jgi:hypothetical protein
MKMEKILELAADIEKDLLFSPCSLFPTVRAMGAVAGGARRMIPKTPRVLRRFIPAFLFSPLILTIR